MEAGAGMNLHFSCLAFQKVVEIIQKISEREKFFLKAGNLTKLQLFKWGIQVRVMFALE